MLRVSDAVSGCCCKSALSFDGAALGVELVGEFAQLAHRDAEGGGDSLEGAPGGVGVAALDQGEGAGRDVGFVGEVFLGRAGLVVRIVSARLSGNLEHCWPIAGFSGL